MSRTVIRISLIAAGAALLAGSYLFLLAVQSGGFWQLYTLAGIASTLVVAGLLSAGLARRHPEKGIWILLIIGQLAFVSLPVFVSDFGLISLLGVVTLTVLIASLSLPSRQARFSVYLALTFGILAALMDGVKPASQLYPSAQLKIFLPGLLILVGLAYIYLLVRNFCTFSLRAQLISIFVFISILSLGAGTLVANITTRRQLTTEANTRLYRAASQTASHVDNFIQSNLAAVNAESKLPVMVQFLALSPEERVGSPLEAQVNQILFALSQKDAQYISSYGLLDGQGMNVADISPKDAGQLEYSRDYFILPLQNGEPYGSPVEFSHQAGEAVIFFSAPVASPAGEILGVLRLRYRASILQDFMVEYNNLAGPESYPFLVDEQHIRLAHGLDPEMVFVSVVALNEDQWVRLMEENRLPVRSRQELSTDLPQFEEALANAIDQPFFSGEVGGTNPALASETAQQQAAIVNLKTRPWQVVFAQPRSRLLAPIEAQTRNTTLLGLLIAGGVTLAGLALAQVLAAPIVQLTQVARQVAAGDFSAQADEVPGSEMSTLASAFNSMTNQLRLILEGLEQRVAERTHQLEQRARQLRASAEVGSAVANLRVLDELLPQVCHLISERFDFYHVGIFLLDASGEYAVLRAANSPGGERMLERDHRLKVGETGIVGYVASRKEARIALDVGQDEVYYVNPDLPETRAEMALPLVIGGTVLGVLDVQSTTPGAFGEEDITILQVLADQVAVAIENARLFAENQAALESTRRAYGQLSREAWANILQKRSGLGYLASRQNALFPARQEWTSEMLQASQTGHAVRAEDGSLTIPIKDRESILGVLRLRKPAGQLWSEQELALAETLAEQLFLALESARLFQETQARAERERLAGEITTKLRASNDPQTILQTAVQELRQALQSKPSPGSSHSQPALPVKNEDGR